MSYGDRGEVEEEGGSTLDACLSSDGDGEVEGGRKRRRRAAAGEEEEEDEVDSLTASRSNCSGEHNEDDEAVTMAASIDSGVVPNGGELRRFGELGFGSAER